MSDEFQAELKILESLRAQVSNRFGLLQCQRNQPVRRRPGEGDFQAVGFLKTLREFVDQLAHHNALLLFVRGQQLMQFNDRMVHQFAGYDKSLYGSGRQLEFQIAEYPLTHSHQPASARLFLDRQFGDPA